MARKVFSHLVLFEEWRFDHGVELPAPSPSTLRGRDTVETELDRSSDLVYCALTMSAVRLDSVQKFLCAGRELFPPAKKTGETANANAKMELDTVHCRLLYVQHLIWRALGRDPDFASIQSLYLFFGERRMQPPQLSDDG
jgi:hypothetical protein